MGSNIVYGLQEDSVAINGKILSDFSDGDIAILDFPNELVEIKKGKDGKSIFAFKKSGTLVKLDLRVLKGSDDDLYLNTLLAAQNLNPHNFILMSGRLSKLVVISNSYSLQSSLALSYDKIGLRASVVNDYQPRVATETYLLNDGVFTKNPSLRANTEGDVQTLITNYSLSFASCIKTLGLQNPRLELEKIKEI